MPIPLWDPVRLAEEISVLDLISKGRVWYAFGIGHRSEEYEHFGVNMTTRGRVADETWPCLADWCAVNLSSIGAAGFGSLRLAGRRTARR